MAGMLLEREMAMEAIESAMTAGLVVVQGPAGRGKTAVLDAVAERSSAAQRLRTWGEQAARVWPFGVLVEALADLVVTDIDRLLAGAAGGARTLFEPNPSVDAAAADELAAARMLALESLLTRLGASGGALVCVDDVHWADEPSLTFLQRLAERGLPPGVQVVVATRTLAAGSRQALDRLLAAATVVELPPLSARAVCELLRSAGSEIDDADGDRALAMTGGNPFLVRQLAAALGEGSINLADGRPLDGAVARPIVARIAAQGLEPLQFAQAIAALGREATVARAGRVAGLDSDAATAAAAALHRLDLLRDEATAELHALVAQALLEDAGAAVCRRLRAVASRVLADDGANPARVAALLIDAEPAGDPGAVTVLERAAAGARSAGAPAEAVQLLERALLEPPAAPARLRVRLALAEARAADGDAAAEADFAAALDLAGTESERVEVLLALARAHVQKGHFAAATEVVGEAEALMGDDTSPELTRAVRAASMLARSFTGPRPGEDGQLAPPDASDSAQLAQSVLTASITGAIDADGARELALRLVDGDTLTGADPGVISMVTGVLYFTGDFDRSIALSTTAMAAPGRTAGEIGVLRYLRAGPLIMSGRLAEAEADARASIKALEPGSGWAYGAYSMLASSLLETEGAEAALPIFADASRSTPLAGIVAQVWHSHHARAELAAGVPEAALRSTDEARRNVIPGTEPYGMTLDDWRSVAALAHLQMGDRDAAAALAREALEIQERWGAAAALVPPLIALGLADDDIATLNRAVDAAREGADVRLRIEALLHRGAAMRRSGRTKAARDDLYAARDIAHAHGFARLGRRATEELDAAGARKRDAPRSGRAALTASEKRVTRLAASGAPNRQIAADLYVSPKTVEFHLANAYRKLGVRNRTELRERLGK